MNKNMNKKWIFLIVVLIAGAFLATSCRTPAGRTPGDVVDDGTITTKVKAKLLEDDRVKGLAVSVTTFEGAVTLTGGVKTDAQKRAAEEIAKSVYGVKKVNNNIIIQK
jgi:osmotically-inducible protein OsmY